VIVSCPGCSTHYQHQMEPHQHTGRCSRCDETFSLENQRPGYVVQPVDRMANTPDPLLAAAMDASQQLDRPPLESLHSAMDSAPADMPLDLESAPSEDSYDPIDEISAQSEPFPKMEPLSDLGEQDSLDPVDSLEPLEEEGDDEDSSFFGSGIDDDEALFGMDDEERALEAGVAEGELEECAEGAAVASRPSHPVRETIGVFLLSGLGGAAGFQGSLQFGFEPLNAIGVGLGAGLTLGWAWIRWAERRR